LLLSDGALLLLLPALSDPIDAAPGRAAPS